MEPSEFTNKYTSENKNYPSPRIFQEPTHHQGWVGTHGNSCDLLLAVDKLVMCLPFAEYHSVCVFMMAMSVSYSEFCQHPSPCLIVLTFFLHLL